MQFTKMSEREIRINAIMNSSVTNEFRCTQPAIKTTILSGGDAHSLGQQASSCIDNRCSTSKGWGWYIITD